MQHIVTASSATPPCNSIIVVGECLCAAYGNRKIIPAPTIVDMLINAAMNRCPTKNPRAHSSSTAPAAEIHAHRSSTCRFSLPRMCAMGPAPAQIPRAAMPADTTETIASTRINVGYPADPCGYFPENRAAVAPICPAAYTEI